MLQPLTLPPLMGLFCFLIYNANFRQIGAGDTLPARYLPLILWHKGTLDLHADARLVAHGHSMLSERNRPAEADSKVAFNEPWAYWMVRTRQHQLASLYPVVAPLLVAPLYYPAVIWLNEHGWSQPNIDRVAELMEKLTASLLASVATVLMFLVLRRDCGGWGLPLALAFGLGTNTWMISSQALWQHGAGELLIALGLLLITVTTSRLRIALLGAVCVLMAANRPPDALIAGAFVLFILWNSWRSALWLLAGAAVPLAALLYYNLHFIGHIGGGYALGKAHHLTFIHLNWSGVPGLLISPARGLFIFSPFFLFLSVGLIQRLRTHSSKGLAVALSFAVVAQVLLYSQADWRAGESWGPRWLTDLLPILVWMLAPAPLVMRPLARGVFILTTVASIAVQAIGAFWYTRTSDELVFAGAATSMRGAWDPRHIPFLTELRHSPAPRELLFDARGSIDRVGLTLLNGGGEPPTLEHGAVLEGWALTGDLTPSQILALIDGVVIGSTTDFLPRSDVNEEKHTTSPSGWRVIANTKGVSPGKRVLQLAVRIGSRSDVRIVCEQRVSVIAQEPPPTVASLLHKPTSASDLDALAERAAQLLRERQSEHGYWLTSFTKKIRYEDPQQEMNTYLTSLLVDLLSPIAGQRGLHEAVEHARRHLAAQIESNGLVRYHGLPDGPTIGTLGCLITPDADDTALAWRIVGPGPSDPRLKGMLKELAHYRDARGLYRTWLAPQKEYQSLDPGSDPNPTDIGIQMHIYLMLRELDPRAAQNLSKAIQRSYGDGDLWVYYTKAPLVPYLRSAELRALGCEVPLPAERLALAAPGQEIWSEAGCQFVKAMESPKDADIRQVTRNLLGDIASDDFALLHHSPPLLYHNDLSASVKRYYWSEDFGYALWLRLYEATGGKSGQIRNPPP